MDNMLQCPRARHRLSRLVLAGLTACLLAASTNVMAHPSSGPRIEPQKGVASFYGDRFQGRPTASGEPFNAQALTAAHPTLPFGTRVLVTRRDNGREVEVRINDRGPYAKGRVIDLSKRAAKALGMISQGTAPVVITAVR
ncbi:rare lipoprotein A [Halomonas cerina]|uniref:Endolytic peptidoglycan transglycosylase RlpA n=2 Tax=Halomonas cerina TaxID=447424 RepID=A0A839V0K9_9GAMM|nr:rare lipoprotein A [Halomonas cerina]